ncbi:hypothetical protein FKP32DRAFT_1546971, partial [Trametes sanguinea]
GENCWKMITIEYQGKQHTAQITDEVCALQISLQRPSKRSTSQCPGCPWGGLDLTPTLFSYLSGSLDAGVLSATWNF